MHSVRAPTPGLGRRFVAARSTWLPVIGIGNFGRFARAGGKVSSSQEGEATTASSGASGNSSELERKHDDNFIDVDVHVVGPTSKAAGTKLTAATSGTGDGDWLGAPAGDWGGTIDAQGIKEPDSSGVLFFFIIIAGLSLVVHQLLRYLGAGGSDDQLARPPRGQVAVAVSTTARAKAIQAPLPTSRPEASAGERPASSADAASGASTGAAESGERSDAVSTSFREGAQKGGIVAAVGGARDGADEGAISSSAEPLGSRSALAGATDSECGTESESTAGEVAEPAASPEKPASDVSAKSELPAIPTATSAAERESGTAAAMRGAELAESTEPRRAVPTPAHQRPLPTTDLSEQERAGEQEDELAAQPLFASTSSGAGSRGAIGRFGGAGRAEHSGLGPVVVAEENGASPSRPSSPFAGATPLFMGSANGGGADPTTSQPEPAVAAPARISIPAVRPEPLSRAPDSSALALLPTDSSLGSLRERAQLALRAAAAAVEASQRAAAYAAAASNAASRAAEAAERAAAAATQAQAGLERAAESAIVAAEARVAQAAEAAKDAEERAASAAAHATAYQDMSQSQADIAERAAAIPRPAGPGPLSQLQQLWRSASSAFSQGHQHSKQPQQRNGPSDGPAGTAGGISSSNAGGAAGSGPNSNARGAGGAADVGSGETGTGHVGSAAAETISTTVKGLLSWLGQGDGTR